MRKNSLFLFLLIVLIYSSCEKETNDFEKLKITVEGTVYLNDSPVKDVTVEFGRNCAFDTDWLTVVRNTGTDGKFRFNEPAAYWGADKVRYRVRVQHPFTGTWTAYRDNRIELGESRSEDFYFCSTK